jgi:hypothetical protein
MEMWIHGDQLGMERVFRVSGHATDVLHGYQRLYKQPCREERMESSFVIRPQ